MLVDILNGNLDMVITKDTLPTMSTYTTKSEKTYEELAAERNELQGAIDQHKHLLVGHASLHKAQQALRVKQTEIKMWIKAHPKHHV